MIPFRKFVNIQKFSECSSYIPLMLILLPTFENTSDIFLNFVVDYQSEHPPCCSKDDTNLSYQFCSMSVWLLS